MTHNFEIVEEGFISNIKKSHNDIKYFKDIIDRIYTAAIITPIPIDNTTFIKTLKKDGEEQSKYIDKLINENRDKLIVIYNKNSKKLAKFLNTTIAIVNRSLGDDTQEINRLENFRKNETKAFYKNNRSIHDLLMLSMTIDMHKKILKFFMELSNIKLANEGFISDFIDKRNNNKQIKIIINKIWKYKSELQEMTKELLNNDDYKYRSYYIKDIKENISSYSTILNRLLKEIDQTFKELPDNIIVKFRDKNSLLYDIHEDEIRYKKYATNKKDERKFLIYSFYLDYNKKIKPYIEKCDN